MSVSSMDVVVNAGGSVDVSSVEGVQDPDPEPF